MASMSDSDGSDSAVDLELRVAQLEAMLGDTVMATDLDAVWIIVSAVLVFFMQVGFAMVSFVCLQPPA